jgi:hypothetical protein
MVAGVIASRAYSPPCAEPLNQQSPLARYRAPPDEAK